MEAMFVIVGVTIVLSIITKVLQRKLIDKNEMKRFNEESKEMQSKIRELLKEAEKNKKEIEEIQTKMLTNSTTMMNKSMRMSLITAPIFLLVFWFLSTLYGGVYLESFIPLPKFNGFFLFNPFSWIPVGLTTQSGFHKMFFFYYMGSALIMGFVEKIYDNIKQKKK